MKVAHLTTVDLSLRYLVFAQLRALRDDGHDVVGISASGPWVPGLEREGIRHVALESSTRGANVGADIRTALELWRVLRRERPDVLHTHNPKPGIYGRIVGRMAGVPIVVNTVHGLYATSDDPWTRRAAVYALEAIAARFSDAELIQNPEDLDFMRRTHITRRARLIGNGVDLARFDPERFTATQRDETRTALGARDHQVLIGAVGRLVAEKGYPELFDAVRQLGSDRYLLVVAGPEDPEKRDALPDGLLADARASGVRLLGHRDDVDALYAAMDVFVLASHREGYPRAAMEAAAMGVPIVATDIRGCREVVQHGHNGLLVPPRDAPALAAAFCTLGDDPRVRTEMGDAGRALARARFDERRVVRLTRDVYREVAVRKAVSDEPTDVLQVITSDDRRGPETHAVALGAALEARGHRVRTIALAPGTHGRGLDVPTLGRYPLAFTTLRRLRREARSAGVVVAHGSASLPACVAALAGTGIPLVYRSIGDPAHWTSTAARRARVRAYLRRAQVVVALTPSAAATIRTRYRVPGDRVTVIPIGVSSDRHRAADAASRATARDHLGVPADADVGAVVGALSPEKDVELAIDAAAGVPGFHLVVAGDGPAREPLERLASDRAPGRVHFTGGEGDASSAFDAADLVLLTSRTEGLPAVLIEAGLRELPVVATNVGYVDEVVIDGETGWLVEPGNRTQLVSAITRVLTDTGQLAGRARQHCRSRFELEGVADAWSRLIDGIGQVRMPSRSCSGSSAAPTLAAAGAAENGACTRSRFEDR